MDRRGVQTQVSPSESPGLHWGPFEQLEISAATLHILFLKQIAYLNHSYTWWKYVKACRSVSKQNWRFPRIGVPQIRIWSIEAYGPMGIPHFKNPP